MACFHTSALVSSVFVQADLRPSARVHVHLLIASKCAKTQSHRCTSCASRSSVNVRDCQYHTPVFRGGQLMRSHLLARYCDRFEVRDTAGGASTAFPFGWPLVPPGSLVRDPPGLIVPKLQTPSALDHVGQIIVSFTQPPEACQDNTVNRTFSGLSLMREVSIGLSHPRLGTLVQSLHRRASHLFPISQACRLFQSIRQSISRLCPLAISSSFVTFKVAAPAYPPAHPSFQSCYFSFQTRLRIVCHIQVHARESYAALYSTLQTADLNCASLTHRIEPT